MAVDWGGTDQIHPAGSSSDSSCNLATYCHIATFCPAWDWFLEGLLTALDTFMVTFIYSFTAFPCGIHLEGVTL